MARRESVAASSTALPSVVSSTPLLRLTAKGPREREILSPRGPRRCRRARDRYCSDTVVGVAVAIRIDLVVLEGVDSAGVVDAIIRVIRDRGTAKHDGAVCILI